MKIELADIIALIVFIALIIAASNLAIKLYQTRADSPAKNQNQELCTQMGKVMETDKAVAVGSMCCTEYTCLEIKR